jgi:chromate transporter
MMGLASWLPRNSLAGQLGNWKPVQKGQIMDRGEGRLGDVAKLALKLGLTAFGGPAAHIAMLHDEVVNRREWLTEEHFLDLLGATNLIPGPNSTEMVIHVGHVRAGWRGLIVAGALFILPAAAIVLAFAWLYVQYGATPGAEWLLYGIKPVVIAVILQAIWSLGKTAVKGRLLGAVGLVVLVFYLLGFNELLLLAGAGLLVMLARNLGRWGPPRMPPASLLSGLPVLVCQTPETSLSIIAQMFLVFLKIGAVLYGSGYVLLAFLQSDFVERLGWITTQQLLDAVAVGQFTPGPVFTTATFIGYVVGGWAGAAVATVGIFLPSFILVAAVNPLVPRLRQSPWAGALLDGVNAASLGLMAGVTVDLGRAAIIDSFTALLAVSSAVLLLRFRVNTTWLILGGIALTILARLLHMI